MSAAVLAAAMALVCQFSPIECATAHRVVVTTPAAPMHNDLAWTDPSGVIYVPDSTVTEGVLPHPDELALALAHELVHSRDFLEGGHYDASTCQDWETRAYAQQARFWEWVYFGRPPHVVDSPLELSSVLLTSGVSPAEQAQWACSTAFG